MARPKLPDSLRATILDLFKQGYSSIEIFEKVLDEAKYYVVSHEELSRCITGIKGKFTLSTIDVDKKKVKRPSGQRTKKFDDTPHRELIGRLHKNMPSREFESACREIVLDILQNYENFERVENGPNFSGTPFDFFGFKEGVPYIVEFKSSLYYFQYPGETQKRRMQELLKRIKDLNIALLQVKLEKAEYQILYNEEMDHLFEGRRVPIGPIEEWIRERL